MKMHIPICHHKTSCTKKLLSLVPHNVTHNFYMPLEYQTLYFFKVDINFFVPSQRICVYTYHIHTHNCAVRA